MIATDAIVIRTATACDAAAARTGALVFQAGTARRDGEFVVAGGRVLSVVGQGQTESEATTRAYAAAALIRFDGCRMRHDIGAPRG